MAASQTAERPHIMVVDDAADVRETLGRLLEAHGFHVSLASDGQQALRGLQAAVPDLIIIDLEMPNIDGRELIRRIRDSPAWSHLPAILSSGTPGTADGWFDASVTKPAPADDMLGAIDALLGRA